ncbi:MAG: hypothetical protein N3B21_16035 [Clostridia bacterium]|nr:hypothetical protein [Clostridia bacterium]
MLEITQKNQKKWFFDIWKKKGLNGKKVWNVEFQICREYLKEHYIDTVEQTFDRLGSIWDYCTGTWLVKIIRDNDNVSRCSTNFVWERIQKAFKNFKSEELVKREKQLVEDAQLLIPGAYGCLTTFAAKIGVSDVNMALKIFQLNGEKYLSSKKKDFKSVVKKKRELIDNSPKKEKVQWLNPDNVKQVFSN